MCGFLNVTLKKTGKNYKREGDKIWFEFSNIGVLLLFYYLGTLSAVKYIISIIKV